MQIHEEHLYRGPLQYALKQTKQNPSKTAAHQLCNTCNKVWSYWYPIISMPYVYSTHPDSRNYHPHYLIRSVQNPMKMSDISFLKTEPTRPQNSKNKNSVSAVRFSKKPTWQFFTLSRSHSSCSIIGSTVKVFFFMPYHCTSSSESLRLTISWTNSARKYVISSAIP